MVPDARDWDLLCATVVPLLGSAVDRATDRGAARPRARARRDVLRPLVVEATVEATVGPDRLSPTGWLSTSRFSDRPVAQTPAAFSADSAYGATPL